MLWHHRWDWTLCLPKKMILFRHLSSCKIAWVALPLWSGILACVRIHLLVAAVRSGFPHKWSLLPALTCCCVCVLSVSSRCSNCSPYSYCKGEGDSAYCECLPGYRTTNQGKCASKHRFLWLYWGFYSPETFWGVCVGHETDNYNFLILYSGWNNYHLFIPAQVFAQGVTVMSTPSARHGGQRSVVPASQTTRATAKSAYPRTLAPTTTEGVPLTQPSVSLKGPTRLGLQWQKQEAETCSEEKQNQTFGDWISTRINDSQ